MAKRRVRAKKGRRPSAFNRRVGALVRQGKSFGAASKQASRERRGR